MSTHPESDFIETDMSSESGPDAPPSYHVAVASQEGVLYLDKAFNVLITIIHIQLRTRNKTGVK